MKKFILMVGILILMMISTACSSREVYDRVDNTVDNTVDSTIVIERDSGTSEVSEVSIEEVKEKSSRSSDNVFLIEEALKEFVLNRKAAEEIVRVETIESAKVAMFDGASEVFTDAFEDSLEIIYKHRSQEENSTINWSLEWEYGLQAYPAHYIDTDISAPVSLVVTALIVFENSEFIVNKFVIDFELRKIDNVLSPISGLSMSARNDVNVDIDSPKEDSTWLDTQGTIDFIVGIIDMAIELEYDYTDEVNTTPEVDTAINLISDNNVFVLDTDFDLADFARHNGLAWVKLENRNSSPASGMVYIAGYDESDTRIFTTVINFDKLQGNSNDWFFVGDIPWVICSIEVTNVVTTIVF